MKTSGDEINETPLRPGILLVESDRQLLNSRSLLLASSHFRVLTTRNACEVYQLRNVTVDLAVLGETLCQKDLRATAECVREQWETARILLLGIAEPWFEDYLYDESVDCRFQPELFLDSIARLCRISQSIGYWCHIDPPKRSTHQDQWRALPPSYSS